MTKILNLQLDETINGVGSKGDQVILKNDNTWELKKSHSINDLIQARSDIEKQLSDQQIQEVSIIEKSVNSDNAKQILMKLADDGYLDYTVVLREQLNKLATCQDISKLFNELIQNWKTEGEGDIAPIEKIINSCKVEGGNIGGRKYDK